MLTDAEWLELAPHMTGMLRKVKDHREATGAELADALKQGFEAPALSKYMALTGFQESNINAIWHHRLAAHGPPCRFCGKLLRTTRARRCLECGKDAV